jgi:Polyprenyl synthetase
LVVFFLENSLVKFALFFFTTGKQTIHQLYGTRVAVLAGDFMFAQSSWFLANLENIEVIKLISQVSYLLLCLQLYFFFYELMPQ